MHNANIIDWSTLLHTTAFSEAAAAGPAAATAAEAATTAAAEAALRLSASSHASHTHRTDSYNSIIQSFHSKRLKLKEFIIESYHDCNPVFCLLEKIETPLINELSELSNEEQKLLIDLIIKVTKQDIIDYLEKYVENSSKNPTMKLRIEFHLIRCRESLAEDLKNIGSIKTIMSTPHKFFTLFMDTCIEVSTQTTTGKKNFKSIKLGQKFLEKEFQKNQKLLREAFDFQMFSSFILTRLENGFHYTANELIESFRKHTEIEAEAESEEIRRKLLESEARKKTKKTAQKAAPITEDTTSSPPKKKRTTHQPSAAAAVVEKVLDEPKTIPARTIRPISLPAPNTPFVGFHSRILRWMGENVDPKNFIDYRRNGTTLEPLQRYRDCSPQQITEQVIRHLCPLGQLLSKDWFKERYVLSSHNRHLIRVHLEAQCEGKKALENYTVASLGMAGDEPVNRYCYHFFIHPETDLTASADRPLTEYLFQYREDFPQEDSRGVPPLRVRHTQTLEEGSRFPVLSLHYEQKISGKVQVITLRIFHKSVR